MKEYNKYKKLWLPRAPENPAFQGRNKWIFLRRAFGARACLPSVKRKCHILGRGGFTLIEIITAVSVFALIVMIVFSAFIIIYKTQKKIFISQHVRDDLQYAIETMSREIRMMEDIGGDPVENDGSKLEFKNSKGEAAEYCLSDGAGNCSSGGKYLARDNKIITSSKVEIEKIKFYVNDFASGNLHPSITVFIKGKGADSGSPASIEVQVTISPRFYNYET